jgi:hypothetical protein
MKSLNTSLFAFSSIAVLSTVIAVGINPTPASAVGLNLVTNGSFENTGSLNRGRWGTFNSIEGWQATTGGKIEVQRDGVAGKAYDGRNLVELDSDDYSRNPKTAPSVLGIFQDIKTKVGKAYNLSFMYSARPNTGAGQNTFSVLFGDSFKRALDGGVGGRQTNWMNYTQTVVAKSASTRLQFNYEGPRDTYGAYIDDVKLTAAQSVPEPTTLAGIAVAGISLVASKKRKLA